MLAHHFHVLTGEEIIREKKNKQKTTDKDDDEDDESVPSQYPNVVLIENAYIIFSFTRLC